MSDNTPTVLLSDENKGFGGAERHAVALAQALRELGALDVLACRKNSWLAQNCADLPVHHVGYRNEVDMLSVYNLYRRLKNGGVNVVHCIGHRDLVAAALARNLPGAPTTVLIKAEHSYPDENLSPLFCWAYAQCQAIVAVSEALLKAVKVAVKPKKGIALEVIANGIDLPEAPSPLPPLEGRPLHIGVLSPLRPGKGHADFLKAASLLKSRSDLPTLRFSIAGDGELREQLQAQAADLQLELEFLGHVEDPMAYLQSLDLSVIPSHRETFSLVTLESLASGRPVVVADNEGASELCQGLESATLYKVGDAQGLSDTISEFCAQAESRQAQATATVAQVRERFSKQRMGERYLELYQRLLS